MKYGNKKKKMGAGGVSGQRKDMMRAAGGMFSKLMKKKKAMIKKRPMKGPEVPMKMDAEGRRGMEAGGVVVSFQDDIKKRFG